MCVCVYVCVCVCVCVSLSLPDSCTFWQSGLVYTTQDQGLLYLAAPGPPGPDTKPHQGWSSSVSSVNTVATRPLDHKQPSPLSLASIDRQTDRQTDDTLFRRGLCCCFFNPGFTCREKATVSNLSGQLQPSHQNYWTVKMLTSR